MKQILPNVFMFNGLVAGRVYALTDDDGVTLIDTSLAVTGRKILDQLRIFGIPAHEVKRILITHAHPDHVGGLPFLKAETGADVICSTIERPVVEGVAAPERPDPETLSGMAKLMARQQAPLPGTPVSYEINDGDVIGEILGGLHVVAAPGHSPGQIAFWQPEKRILFCGDAMMNLFGLRLPFAAFTTDMSQAKASIKRLAQLNPAIICFGHGPVLAKDAAEKLHGFANGLTV